MAFKKGQSCWWAHGLASIFRPDLNVWRITATIQVFCLFNLRFFSHNKEEHDIPADSAEEPNHDPQFEPIVSLPEQDVKTLEEDEEELFKMYALYTFFF